jgi:hypothetical protein
VGERSVTIAGGRTDAREGIALSGNGILTGGRAMMGADGPAANDMLPSTGDDSFSGVMS